MKNQSLIHESSTVSDFDISVHSALSSEGHSTTHESIFTSGSTSKKPLGCMSIPNDNDREFGNFHVNSEEGSSVGIC